MGSSERNEGRERSWKRRLGVTAGVAAIALAALGTVVVSKDRASSLTEKVRLEQCANLGSTCDASNPAQWQNGNLNSSQAEYYEGESVPYRAVVTNVTPGQTYALSIEWESTKNGKHAHDYLTSYDFSESGADLCSGSVCSGSPQLLSIPVDPELTIAGVTPASGQKFNLYGGTFTAAGAVVTNTGNLCATPSCTVSTNPSAYSLVGTYADTSQTRLTIYVTATESSFVLGWGGHIATRLDWGLNGSAVSISGSPYHMNMHDFQCSDDENCGVGSQDRAMDANAVIFASSITIIKSADPESAATFGFTASPSPLTNFDLVDDGTTSDRKIFSGITNFTTYTVTENVKSGWDFGNASCVIAAPFGGSYEVSGRTVTINLKEGEIVTCTFTNAVTPASTTTTTTSTTTTVPETTTTVPETTTTVPETTTTVPETTTTAPEVTTTVPATSTTVVAATSTTELPVLLPTTTAPGLPVILPGTGGGSGRDWLSLGALALLASGAAATLIAGSRARQRRMRSSI